MNGTIIKEKTRVVEGENEAVNKDKELPESSGQGSESKQQ